MVTSWQGCVREEIRKGPSGDRAEASRMPGNQSWSWAYWHMAYIPALRRVRQEDLEFKARLSYVS
jgi:hypothetical protein